MGPLYLRIDGKETVQISNGPTGFVAATPDGSKVLYRADEKEGLKDLYEYDVGKAETTPIAAETYGVAGASEDTSRVYFVSRKALAGAAQAGKPNLYLREVGGGTSFVASLATTDVSNSFLHLPFSLASSDTTRRGARTTPEGAHLAFVSKASPTGYDNADAADGQASLEVYLYDAAGHDLHCVSCNPSGARPAGRKVEGSQGTEGRVAAELPTAENQFSIPRALSNDGNKLFFNSYEALVPRDANGKEDVYEWERSANAEGCKELGAELYVPSAAGCLSLISSGQSSEDSQFDDASPDGRDVFIKTSSSLLPQDDSLIDVYDAREGGGYPPPPGVTPACEGEACQGPPTPPNDPTPASSAFEGAGNVPKSESHEEGRSRGRRSTPRRSKREPTTSGGQDDEQTFPPSWRPRSWPPSSCRLTPRPSPSTTSTSPSLTPTAPPPPRPAPTPAMTTTLDFATKSDPKTGKAVLDGAPKDVIARLPTGQLGDPLAVPQLQERRSAAGIEGVVHSGCPDGTAVGNDPGARGEPASPAATAVYSLDPPPGAVLKLGFIALVVPGR